MTSPAHIAMFSIAAHGHVNPSLEVIRELVARGHRVTYAIPPAFAEKVAETGAEPKQWTSTLPGPEVDPEAWGTTLLDNVEPFLDDAIQALPQLVEAYEGDEPDLILHDIASYPARVLGHRWGVPVVSLSPCMVAWEGYEKEVGEPMWEEPLKTERGRAYYARFHAWLEENGITMHPDPFAGRPARSLVLIPKALQPHADRVDETVYTFVGACQGDRTAEGSGGVPRAPRRSSSSPSGRPSPSSPPSTGSASRRSPACPAGTWCSRSAGTSTPPSWATYRGTWKCGRGCRSWRSSSRPTCSSPTRAPAAARRAWPPPRR